MRLGWGEECSVTRPFVIAAMILGGGALPGLMAPRVCYGQSVAESAPWGASIHADMSFMVPVSNSRPGGANTTPTILSGGLGAGYELSRRFELDLTVESCVAGTRAVMPAPAGGLTSRTTTPGTLIRGLGQLRLGSWPRLHALLAAGPALFVAGNFGTVPVLDLEAGLEFHARLGLYFLLAYELMEPVLRSRPEFDPAICVTDDCPSRFNPAYPIFGMRLALGLSF